MDNTENSKNRLERIFPEYFKQFNMPEGAREERIKGIVPVERVNVISYLFYQHMNSRVINVFLEMI